MRCTAISAVHRRYIRRSYMKKTVLLALAITVCLLMLVGCSSSGDTAAPTPGQTALPAPTVDESTMFSVDRNINMTTIDSYLDRDDVVYRDVRMLFDPADYGSIGGEADLTRTIEGFKVVPFPYIATLQTLPVEGAYEGDRLFDVVWAEDGTVSSAKARYSESMMVLEELFPKDKAIFLMCGGGGYANMMKQLLLYFGWDESLLYNIGANWEYKGENALELIVYPEDKDGSNIYATWRADYAYLDFSRLNRIGD